MKHLFKIESNPKEIPPVLEKILGLLKQENISSEILHDIKLATEEAIINAIKHGNRFRENLPVIINFEYSKDRISISVEDRGMGYDYGKIPDPTLDENITRGHGRGVFLIRKIMDEVSLNKIGNRIEMVKYIK